MGWQDRDYTRDPERSPWRDWHAWLPRPASATLIGIHVVGFIVVMALGFDGAAEALRWFPLSGTTLTPAAIALHPIAANTLLSLATTVVAIWLLGSRLEDSIGPNRLWWHYVFGNLVGGLAYYVSARAWPTGAAAELAIPLGALTAWCLVAWRVMAFDYVDLFGQAVSAGRVAVVIALVVIALQVVRFWDGSVAWVSAAICGAATAPALESLWLIRRPLRAPAVRRRRPAVLEEDEVARDDGDIDGLDASDDEPAVAAPNEREIDAILEKISREGMASLSAREREVLEAARQARLRDERGARVR